MVPEGVWNARESAEAFRERLRKGLEASETRVLLRILPARNAPVVELTGPEIVRRGLALAAAAQAPERGVVLLLLPHSVELFLLHIGLVLSGRVPAILAWPTTRVDVRKYHENLLHQLRSLPAVELMTLPGLAASLDAGLPYAVTPFPVAGAEAQDRGVTLDLGAAPLAKKPAVPSGDTPSEILFLQFSGGTTGAQKCVVVTAPMLSRQLDRLAATLAFDPARDGVASWLPLYHDMGLIACLWLPLYTGAPSFHVAASDWLLAPDLLFQGLDRHRATFSWLPNFAFSYLAGARERMSGPYDLRHVRGFVNCSEPVRERSIATFAATFADWGVAPGQLQASYAMAENVFAVTQTPLGARPKSHPRAAVRGRGPDLAFDLVDDVYLSSGPPLTGVELRISAADGRLVGSEEEPGGIEIRTESMFDGYWGNEGFQRSALTADGFYQTGDFGFRAGGELFVIGRTKDIIIVGGQNVFPEDVEAIASSVAGIYPGRVAAFGVADAEQGTESLCIVAEMRGDFDERAAGRLAGEIRSLVVAAIGIAPRAVWVKPERWMVKSTAGKISRKETRIRFLEERAAQAPA